MSLTIAKKPRSRARNYCFTLNNPTEAENPLDWKCKYIVYQLERGENGTEHYQGFIQFENQVSFSSMKAINERAHWEVARCVSASIDYCQKEDTRIAGPWTKGKLPREGQGERRDISEMKESIDEGATLEQIADEHFATFLRYRTSIIAYKAMKQPKRTEPPQIRVYWGPTGVGKSRRAAFEAPDAYFKMKTTSTGDWWDGYEGQDSVIINDFYGWIQHCELLRLLDRYQQKVKVHGGYVEFNAKLIIITSNQHPSKWYNAEKLPYEGGPLERRLMEYGKVSCMLNEWTEEQSEEFIGPRRQSLELVQDPHPVHLSPELSILQCLDQME